MILSLALVASGAIYVADRCDRWWRARTRTPPARAGAEPHADGPRDEDAGLILSGGALALTSVGRLAWPPLALLGASLMVVSVGELYLVAWRTWRRDGQVGSALVAALTYTATIALGQFIAAAVMLALDQASTRLARATEDRAQHRWSEIFERLPVRVRVVRDGAAIEVPLHEVLAGEAVLAEAGEVIAVDGSVLDGGATVDERALTGEALPAVKEVGAPVFAATLVLEGRMLVKIEQRGDACLAARFARLLQHSRDYRAEVRSRGDRMADAGALPTVVASAVTLPLRGSEAALSVLFASFGYTMRHSAPLAVLGSLQLAAADGIFVKDGRAFERMAEIDAVIFDKTGTLTTETFRVAEIHCEGGFDASTLLTLIAAAEARQSHPIARALVAAAHARGLDLPGVEDVVVAPGAGVRARVGGRTVAIGNRRWIGAPAVHAAEAPQGLTRIHVTIDGALAGSVDLCPEIRGEAAALVRTLRSRGIEVWIASGDRAAAAEPLAVQLDVDGCRADMLPQDKVTLVEAMRARGRRVCFIGDGINDAPALRAADVSVSLGGASALATDQAAIVLVDGDLGRLVRLHDLARELDRSLRFGAALSLVPGAACIVGVYLAGFGLAHAVVLYNAALGVSVAHALGPALRARGAPAHPRDRR